jgi:phage-related holin
MDNVNNFKAAVTACIAVLTALWGWFGWLVVLFVVAMAADYLTGTAAAMQKGKWSSKAARDGIFHKVGSIVVVAVAGVSAPEIICAARKAASISSPENCEV